MITKDQYINKLFNENRKLNNDIKTLQEDVLFLKKALGLAIENRTLVYYETVEPEFILDENMNGDILIRRKDRR